MNSFNHIIITRYNLYLDKWKVDKRNNKVRTENWMSERLDLFKNFTLSAMKNQSTQNFQWFIYFDNDTTKDYIHTIEELIKNNSNYHILFANDYNHFQNKITEDIKDICGESDFLITSRLDNDDWVDINYVELIQNQFDFQLFLVLNFHKGYCLKTTGSYIFSEYTGWYSGPFISLIEKENKHGFKTIMEEDHETYYRQKYNLQHLDNAVTLQIIHTRNSGNHMKGKPIKKDNLLWIIFGEKIKYNRNFLQVFSQRLYFWKTEVKEKLTGERFI